MINIRSFLACLFHHQGLNSRSVSILSTIITCYFWKLILEINSVLKLSLMIVSWRFLKLQESYVQEMHGEYDEPF